MKGDNSAEGDLRNILLTERACNSGRGVKLTRTHCGHALYTCTPHDTRSVRLINSRLRSSRRHRRNVLIVKVILATVTAKSNSGFYRYNVDMTNDTANACPRQVEPRIHEFDIATGDCTP